ncbi:hypothetical protein FHS96_002350 [Sphingomonas zeicaulis]
MALSIPRRGERAACSVRLGFGEHAIAIGVRTIEDWRRRGHEFVAGNLAVAVGVGSINHALQSLRGIGLEPGKAAEIAFLDDTVAIAIELVEAPRSGGGKLLAGDGAVTIGIGIGEMIAGAEALCMGRQATRRRGEGRNRDERRPVAKGNADGHGT